MADPTCPACGAALPFRSAVSTYAVCRSCGSTVVRSGEMLEAMGRMAVLPGDLSPVQLGSTLDWDRQRFTVLGRTRVGWADGAWNEWFVSAGERFGWLAEAQGAFALAFEQQVPPELAGPLPVLGATVSIDGARFTVADLKQAACIGSEGELPFAAPQGRTARYLDMVGADGHFAGLEESAEGRRLYLGRYAPFDAFRFAQLRTLDGWRAPGAAVDHRGDPLYA